MFGVEAAARAGYVAKGAIYALIGVLAIQAALGAGGEASGTREAIRTFASGPLGRVVLVLLVVGLAGYVLWRFVQGLFDPVDGSGDRDQGWARLGLRAFYLASAVLYGLLALYGVQLLLGSGGSADGDGGWAARMMEYRWGRWLVAIVGLGVVGRGLFQFVKAYTASFRDRIRSYELQPGRERVAVAVSRVGLSARGVIFGIVGVYLVFAGLGRDPSDARGLAGALATLRDQPWLLGAIGAGLLCYAVYQWTKARYRMIDL